MLAHHDGRCGDDHNQTEIVKDCWTEMSKRKKK